jgi:ParB-like nuclease domain
MDKPIVVDGITVPAELAGAMAPIDAFKPNPWNPNKMDEFAKEKLAKSIHTDGFILPLLVRPMSGEKDTWEIVDGEHRWRVATSIGMTRLPYVNLGDIDDLAAKAITIRANALRGEFDSIELAKLMAEMVESAGSRDLIAEAMPWRDERTDALLGLHSSASLAEETRKIGGSVIPATRHRASADDDEEAIDLEDFGSFDPKKAKFAHTCPRCKFQFNE